MVGATVAAGSASRLAAKIRGGKREALGASGIDHLARNDLEMALLLPVPAAHVSAITSDYHSTTRRPLGSNSDSPYRLKSARAGTCGAVVVWFQH
jgi:hypothetical protein